MDCRIILKDAQKGYTRDQDKLLDPQETVRRFKERLKTLKLDILESTVRIDNGRLGIPVYFSVCGRDAQQTIGTAKQMGKGGTPQQAEASAVMELAERFSLFSFCKDESNFFTDTYQNVKDRALSFEAIAKSVHDRSPDLDKAKAIFSNLPLRWTSAFNLTRDQEVLIPFDWFFAINAFNGPCAGNGVEEAILQGICEVVERHVSSIVCREKLQTPAIDPDSVTDPLVEELIRKYRNAGIELFISDFSLNTGIPSVGVLAWDPSTFPETSEIVWTAGTTPNPQKALSRALTEVAQLAGDFNTNANYAASGLPKLKSLEEAGYVVHPESRVRISDLPDLSNENIRIEVENCIQALSAAGMEVIVINVTHGELAVPAFYTIIPGAHFRERAAGTSVGMFCAKLVAESGNPGWALGELAAMDRQLPGKYYIKFFQGVCHLSLNEPSTALPLFEEALNLGPHEQDIPSIYSYMGMCFKALEQYARAIEVLEKGRRHDNDRTDIHNLMGFCYFKLREHEKAIACFREVLRLDPGSAIDYANIASNYRDMGNKKKAVAYYRLALELDPALDFAKDNLRRLAG